MPSFATPVDGSVASGALGPAALDTQSYSLLRDGAYAAPGPGGVSPDFTSDRAAKCHAVAAAVNRALLQVVESPPAAMTRADLSALGLSRVAPVRGASSGLAAWCGRLSQQLRGLAGKARRSSPVATKGIPSKIARLPHSRGNLGHE